MQNSDTPPKPESPVNMPMRMIFDLADKARADEIFWTAFKDLEDGPYDADQKAKAPSMPMLIDHFTVTHLGENHGYNTTTLILMLRGHAIRELGHQNIFIPTEEQTIKAIAHLRSRKEYWDYAVANRGSFRDKEGRRAGQIIRDMFKRIINEFFNKDYPIFTTVINQEINKIISKEQKDIAGFQD